MKNTLIVLFMIMTLKAQAICIVPLSRNNVNPGEIPTSTGYNNDFDNLYTRSNNVPGDCFADGSVRAKQIENAALDSSHFADASVTASKFASGVIPTMGKLLRVKVFTASGTWIKLADMQSIVVEVVGGGGGNGGSADSVSSGGTSSFGSHCSATGGSLGKGGTVTGSGGSGSSGDINLTGGSGERAFLTPIPRGGASMFGPYGRGAPGQSADVGGGAGGYCLKVIQKASLADTVTVTVGAGGSGFASGKSGMVLIYEYGE